MSKLHYSLMNKNSVLSKYISLGDTMTASKEAAIDQKNIGNSTPQYGETRFSRFAKTPLIGDDSNYLISVRDLLILFYDNNSR